MNKNSTDLFEAFKIIGNVSINRNSEVLNIKDAFNKKVAKEITAPFDLPDSDISRMDGYAVNSEISDFSKPFRIYDELYAAQEIKHDLKPNYAIKVATGAKLGFNIDKVIPLEYAKSENNLLYLQNTGKNWIQKKGSIIKKGDIVLKKGDIIDHRKIELLTSLRINSIEVFSPIKVGLLSTGSELTEYFFNHSFILNSNYYMISSFLHMFDTNVTYLGIEKDNLESIKNKIEKNIHRFDIFITIGGTGFSKADLIEEVVNSLGGKVLISSINASPGKTFKFATVKEKPIFILPGNPQSAIVCTELFIGFFLHGLSAENLLLKIPIKFSLNKKKGFYKIIKSITTIENDTLVSYDLFQYDQKGFRSLVIVDKEKSFVEEGDLCDTFLLFYL